MSVVAFILISVIAIIYLAYKHKNKRAHELFYKLPSPPFLPILEHSSYFYSLATDEQLNTINKLLVEYNGIITIHWLWVKLIFVSDADIAINLLRSNLVKKSDVHRLFEDWLQVTLFTAEGNLWKKYLTLLSSALHVENFEQYMRTCASASNFLVENMKSSVGKSVNVYEYLEIWSINAAVGMLLNLSSDTLIDVSSKYAKCVHAITTIVANRIINPLKYSDFTFRFSRDFWKQRRAIRYVKNQTKIMLEKAISAESERASKRKAKTFLDIIRENRGTYLSDEEILNHCQGLIFAGFDTMSIAVSCALYLLSIHQDVQEKAFCEIKNVFAGKDETKECTLRDTQKMFYLEMVIKETMRLFPPAPLTAKHTLEDISIGNYVIPKGMEVLISIDGIHKNEKYFPNPLAFDPERFAPENEANIKPFSYLPFSAGQRTCIGQKLAIAEMKMVIAMILRNFQLIPVEGFRMKLWPFIVQSPDDGGVQVIFQNREN